MRKQYLELFKDISSKIDKALLNIVGTDKAKEEIKRGAFGDMTVYIDKIAEDIVIESIKKSGLKCSILTEETGLINIGSNIPIVVVDPIDGSLNAKRGMPYFSFSIALSEGEKISDITVGYVKNLSNKDEFYAMKDLGAFLNSSKISTNSKKLNIVAVEGFKKKTDPNFITFVFLNFNKVRQMGSMALDICYLATGAFDIFLNFVPSRVIDYAAAKIILEESGGELYSWLSNKKFEASISQKTGDLFFGISNKNLLKDFLSMMEDLK